MALNIKNANNSQGLLEATRKLPPLRSDLKLIPSYKKNGFIPTYNIFDPIKNKYYKIGWLEYEILIRWDLQTPQKIITEIRRETTLYPDINNIKQIKNFLSLNCLLKETGEQNLEKLKVLSGASQPKSLFKLILQNYLFFKIPLIKPDEFLEKTYKYTDVFYSKKFLQIMTILLLFSSVLIFRKFDEFLSTFMYFFNIKGMIVFFLALGFSKIVHELAHAYSAKRYGCYIPTMGIAFIVMCPVLYTDTSDAWKISSKKQRIIIGSSGMIAEICVAIIALFLWNFMPNGAFRSAMFVLSTTVWITTIFINLSPFMRFDGYYILSDLLEVENLQQRAFRLGRWFLREVMFGFGAKIPENFSKFKRNILIIYAYGTWVYRFFLYLSIALAVYFYVFKLLGILLMAVELVWFLSRPIANEIKIWWKMRKNIKFNKNVKISVLLLVFILFLSIYPLPTRIVAPAVLEAKEHKALFVPQKAVLKEINVKRGDFVKKGEILFELTSPEIDLELRKIKTNISAYEWQVSHASSEKAWLEKRIIHETKLKKEHSKTHGLKQKRSLLIIKSPYDGKLTEMAQNLKKGQWYQRGFVLASITRETGNKAIAYVNQGNVLDIKKGNLGVFIPYNMKGYDKKIKLKDISINAVSYLEKPYMASVKGGKIAARENQEKKLIPVEPVYKVSFDVVEKDKEKIMENIVLGDVVIRGKKRSFLLHKLKKLASILIRESSF